MAAVSRAEFEQVKRELASLAARVDELGSQTTGLLDSYGRYKNRTEPELRLIRDQLDGQVLPSIENLIEHAKATDAEQRARALRKRAKGHRTRVQNALDAAS